jgi:phosphoribosylformimino-5-aminoimidazole carboxamide ribotide isomerase
MQLIPAIDLRDGHCVRLLHGDFDAETRYAADPEALLLKYRGAGADWLHIVDLDGARGRTDGGGGGRTDGGHGDGASGGGGASGGDNRAIILRLAAHKAVKLQVGGGLRNTAALAQMLDSGVERVVVGSAALTQVDQVQAWLRHFGADRLTLAFDVCVDSGPPLVRTHGWQRQSEHTLWSAVDCYLASELQHVLCTDVGRDGALTGPNLELYAEAVRRYPQIHWQASGGIRNARDLHALAETGATAAISGKALLEDLIPFEELQPFLPNA